MKSLIWICLALALSPSSLSAVDKVLPSQSTFSFAAAMIASTFLRAVRDPFSESFYPEVTDDMPSGDTILVGDGGALGGDGGAAGVGSEAPLLAQRQQENTASLDVVSLNDPRFSAEFVLPVADNNCALFGIYGRSDITREEVVESLIAELNAGTPLSHEIGRLIAVEIFDHLRDEIEAGREGALLGRLSSERNEPAGNSNARNLRAVISKCLEVYKSNPNNENEAQLLRFFSSPLLIRNYLNNVILQRIGGDNEDPYPLLEIHTNEPNHEGGPRVAGVLAAVAAMRGVNLEVYHRNRQGEIDLMLAYGLPQACLQRGEEAPTVHLLHTTADYQVPDVRNHFNLLKPVAPFSEYFLSSAGMDLLSSFFTVRMPKERLKNSEEDRLVHCISLPFSQLDGWVQQLGFKVQNNAPFQRNLKNYPDYPFAQLDGFNLRFAGDVLDEGFPVFDFGEDDRDVLEKEWRAFISRQQQLFDAIKKVEFDSLWQLSPKVQKSQLLSSFMRSIENRRQSFLYSLHFLETMKPTVRNLQLLMLIFDAYLKDAHIFYTNQPDLREQIHFLVARLFSNESVGKHGKGRQAQEKDQKQEELAIEQEVEALTMQISAIYRNDVLLARYFLSQVLHLCDLYQYKPSLPYYFSKPELQTDEHLNNALYELLPGERPRKQSKKQAYKQSRKKTKKEEAKTKEAPKALEGETLRRTPSTDGLVNNLSMRRRSRPDDASPSFPPASLRTSNGELSGPIEEEGQPPIASVSSESYCYRGSEQELEDQARFKAQPIVNEADLGHTNPNIIIREGSQSREEELEGANGIKIEKIERDRSFDFQSKKSIEGPIANATTGTLIEHVNENDAYRWDPVASERYRQEKIGQVVNTRTSGQEIVLTPEERAAFHEYLNEHAKEDLIGHFESLLGATNRSLTQPEMNRLAIRIEPYLRSFLLSRRHPDNSFVFTWETLDRFVKEFLRKDETSFHNFHPSEGQGASLPKSWLEHKRTHWISLGLMPAIVGNRSTFAAQNNYQKALARRCLSEMKKEGKTDSENKKKSSKKDKKSKK